MVSILSLSSRYSLIETLIETHFDDSINNISYNIRGRMRVLFKNGAVLDIRYPVDSSYSFYLNYSGKMYRIDTAPHYEKLDTFPQHCHFGTEENILQDIWTSPNRSTEDNIKGMISWLAHIFNS